MALTRYLRLSIAAAVATIALKMGAWWTTGSVGLLSDAMEAFVNLAAAGWMAAGGVAASVGGAMAGRKAGPGRERQALPADMSTASLLGGGLIAGDALAALALGLAGLLAVTWS